MSADWNHAALATLRRLWAAGVTAQKIAGTINEMSGQPGEFTRNSIVGKAHRLLLDRRPSPIKPPNPNSTRKSRVRAKPTTTAEPKVARTPEPNPILPKRRAMPIIAWEGKPVDQFEIKPGQCRTIVQDDPRHLGHVLMCAAPTAVGEPYCPACRARMWVGFKAPQAGEAA